MANWSDTNQDLLVLIVRRIEAYDDFVSFGYVCKSWKSATLEDLRYKDRHIPWLMLPPLEQEKSGNNIRSFYHLAHGICPPRRLTLLQKGNWNRCFSSQGWLITICQDLSMILLHPFSRAEIKLPNISTCTRTSIYHNWYSNIMRSYKNTRRNLGANFLNKCVLSSDPSFTSDYIVMVIMVIMKNKCILAYWKAGDEAWTLIDKLGGYMYLDVAYYKGQFYAITSCRKIMVCDTESNQARQVAELPSGLLRRQYAKQLYLVESVGELLVVSREGLIFRDNDESSCYTTFGFKVFKVDVNTKTWTEMQSLGNRAIFLGHNSSFSIEALQCLQPNCIYFTQDCLHSCLRGKGMGIYNLQDGSIKLFSEVNSYSNYSYPDHNMPMWVE